MVSLSKENLAEYARLQEIYNEEPFRTISVVRAKFYQEFYEECDDFMVSLVLHDQDIVFGSDSLTTRVDRSQRLFQTILRPAQSSLEKVYRNVITLRNIVMHKKFNNYWPATSWIFAPKMTESFDETNSTILQYDSVA